MNLTIKIDGFCAGGNHIHMTITAGGKDFPLTLEKEDFNLTPSDIEVAAVTLLRSFVKKSGLTDWGQIKTAVEAEVFKL